MHPLSLLKTSTSQLTTISCEYPMNRIIDRNTILIALYFNWQQPVFAIKCKQNLLFMDHDYFTINFELNGEIFCGFAHLNITKTHTQHTQIIINYVAGRVLVQRDLMEGKHKSDSIKSDDSGE